MRGERCRNMDERAPVSRDEIPEPGRRNASGSLRRQLGDDQRQRAETEREANGVGGAAMVGDRRSGQRNALRQAPACAARGWSWRTRRARCSPMAWA